MIACRSLKHMMIFLGTALLLPMGVVYAEGPRCAAVLLQPVSVNVIDQTVAGLAEMRINIDQAKARGNRSIADRKMIEAFTAKMDEFSERLSSQISKEELRALISKKVLSLQGIKEKEVRQENLNRANEKESIPFYSFTKRIAFPDPHTPIQEIYIGGLKQINYVKKADSLYFNSLGQLLSWNLKTEKLEQIAKFVQAYRPTLDGMIVSTAKPALFFYDVASKERQDLPIKDLAGKTFGDLSHEGKLVAAIDKNKVEIFSAKTGQQMGFVFKDLYSSIFKYFAGEKADLISFTKFISDSEILITSSSKRAFKFNFITGESKELDFGERTLIDVFLRPESQMLVLYFEGEITSIAVKDLENFEAKAVKKSKWWIKDILFLNDNLIVVRSDSYRREIMNLRTMEVVSDLSEEQSPGGIDSQAVGYDPESGNLFFGTVHEGTTNIDIWSRQ